MRLWLTRVELSQPGPALVLSVSNESPYPKPPLPREAATSHRCMRMVQGLMSSRSMRKLPSRRKSRLGSANVSSFKRLFLSVTKSTVSHCSFGWSGFFSSVSTAAKTGSMGYACKRYRFWSTKDRPESLGRVNGSDLLSHIRGEPDHVTSRPHTQYRTRRRSPGTAMVGSFASSQL